MTRGTISSDEEKKEQIWLCLEDFGRAALTASAYLRHIDIPDGTIEKLLYTVITGMIKKNHMEGITEQIEADIEASEDD